MAINFAGGTKYLSVSGTPPVTAPPFTAGLWFKAPNITAAHPLFYIGNSVSTSDFFAIAAQGTLAGDPVSIRTHSGGALDQCNTSTGFSANTWHHACGVWASTTSRFAYLDAGGVVETTAPKAPSGPDLMGIGATLDASPNFGEAIIAEVGLWDVALTAADVAMLAKGVSPLLVRPDALVAYWPLLRNSDPSVDRVGGYSMAWTGGPTEAEHPRIYYPTAQILQFPPAAAGGYTMIADGASYTMTPQDVGLTTSRLLTADNASYTLSPQDVVLSLTRTMTADVASYTMSPQDVAFTVSRLLTADNASYTFSPQDADLVAAAVLTADVSTYSMTPQDVGLLVSRLLTADHATFTLTPQDAGLSTGKTLTADEVTFTTSPQDAVLLVSRLLTAGEATFTFSPQDVDLSIGADYTLTADHASFTASPQDVDLLVSRYMEAEYSAYVLTVQDANFYVGVTYDNSGYWTVTILDEYFTVTIDDAIQEVFV